MLRAAILGAGGMGHRHAQSLKELETVSLRAVCDVKESAANELAQSYNARVYTDFDKMLREEKPDLLFLCLPPFAHNGEVEKAADLGIHIFIEKPIALEEGRARSMVEAIEKNGVISQVGYHYRFGEAVCQLKKLMDSGKAGKPVLFNARYECNSLHSPWWRQKDKCGSQILEQAIHLYDMALYLMGPIEFSTGLMANLCHADVPNYTIEDVSASLLRFCSGALGSITATNCAVPGKWENPFTAVFENVTAQFTDPNHAVFWDTSGEEPVESTVCGEVDMYLEEVRAFVEAVLAGKKSSCPIQEGYQGLCLVKTVSDNAKEA